MDSISARNEGSYRTILRYIDDKRYCVNSVEDQYDLLYYVPFNKRRSIVEAMINNCQVLFENDDIWQAVLSFDVLNDIYSDFLNPFLNNAILEPIIAQRLADEFRKLDFKQLLNEHLDLQYLHANIQDKSVAEIVLTSRVRKGAIEIVHRIIDYFPVLLNDKTIRQEIKKLNVLDSIMMRVSTDRILFYLRNMNNSYARLLILRSISPFRFCQSDKIHNDLFVVKLFKIGNLSQNAVNYILKNSQVCLVHNPAIARALLNHSKIEKSKLFEMLIKNNAAMDKFTLEWKDLLAKSA